MNDEYDVCILSLSHPMLTYKRSEKIQLMRFESGSVWILFKKMDVAYTKLILVSESGK